LKVAIRTDASTSIGSGHLMRCITLADALRQIGAHVEFVSRDLPGNLNSVVTEKGFALHQLPSPEKSDVPLNWNRHASWLGVHWHQDAEECADYLGDGREQYDWLIVDHYALDKNWEQLHRPIARKIMVIDDLADREHDCDLLVDQNIHCGFQHRYRDLVPEKCDQLLGPSYALLRPEFSELREKIKPRDGKIDRVLIYFGGVDGTNETMKVLDAISAVEETCFSVDVIVGDSHPHKDDVLKRCNRMHKTRCYPISNRISSMIVKADLAIGAGGVTSLERFCLGLPSIVISVAENQNRISRECGLRGLQLFLGEASKVKVDHISSALQTVIQSPTLLQFFSKESMKVVDGKGVSRVMQKLFPLEVRLRLAELQDSVDVFSWRNSEETRRHIFNRDLIPFEVHQEWFEKCLNSENRVILIGEIDNKAIGVLRYDLTDAEALISVYLVPGKQPPGTGSQLIAAGSAWVRENYPHIKKVNAEILCKNTASVKAFEKAGYLLDHLTYTDILS